MIFTPRHYRSLKTTLQKNYQTELKTTLNELSKLPPTDLREWIADHRSELKEFSSMKWFFLKQLQSFSFLSKSQKALSTEDFGELEDEVFERWNQSEFADLFLRSLNKGTSFSRSSKLALRAMDHHLVSLGNHHILKTEKVNRDYRAQTSLGDVVKQGKLSRLLATTMHLEGKELGLMTATMREMKTFSQRIEIALKVIRKFSPSSWERFVAFTETIVPIKQKEFVSYSHQELPGVSMINLFDRDFVDLMDDLIHENGHHHLNYYLNNSKLIDEPIESIYYSPWRRTLRPLRGIYHAYFTFFWAFKLFSDLANAKDQDSIWYLFSAKEKEKIYWRAVEEFYMLEYSFMDLKWAFDHGFINKRGWNLILEQRKILQKMKGKIPLWERKLKAHKADLKSLKNDLKIAQQKYLKT